MQVIAVFVLWCSCAGVAGLFHFRLGYKIVRVGFSAYLIRHNIYREIQDNETVASFGLEWLALERMTSVELSQFGKGEPVALIPNKFVDGDIDGPLNSLILKLKAMYMEDILEDRALICDQCKNPSSLLWNKHLLFCSEFVWKPNSIEFGWISSPSFPLAMSEYLGIKYPHWETLIASRSGSKFPQYAECRMQKINDRSVIISFSTIGLNAFLFEVGYLQLDLEPSGHVVISQLFEHVQWSGQRGKEKNWISFLENGDYGDLLFVQQINPLHIVKPTIEFDFTSRLNISRIQSVSLSPLIPDIYEFGDLRGGTNAILLDDRHGVHPPQFLALFHSRKILGTSNRMTYFMGAYTFSCTAPFRLLSISSIPLVDTALYTGPWFPFHTPADYVVYPTTIFMNNTKTIFLVMGHNDNLGYMYAINLRKLLSTLDPIESFQSAALHPVH
jgi:hypothetical protein